MKLNLIKHFGRALLVFFVVNVLLFVISYISTYNVETIRYQYGAFSINHTQVGYTLQEAAGFIFVLFLLPVLNELRKYLKKHH